MPVLLVYLALLAVVFFFLIVRPQRRQMAARRALIAAVDVGDDIITAGGLYGTVRAIEGDVLSIEVAAGVVLTLAREAVARRRDDAEALEPGPDEDHDHDHDHADHDPDGHDHDDAAATEE
ncbi:MAG: preprotein translocase subunit YajC [Acidimicrobiia bacterium]